MYHAKDPGKIMYLKLPGFKMKQLGSLLLLTIECSMLYHCDAMSTTQDHRNLSVRYFPDGLWLGLSHQLQLTIDTGSFSYTDATQMSLSTPPDLQLTPSTIVLPPVGCNQKLQFAVMAHAALAPLSPPEVTYQVCF